VRRALLVLGSPQAAEAQRQWLLAQWLLAQVSDLLFSLLRAAQLPKLGEAAEVSAFLPLAQRHQ
jgi:hypothetical protein